MENVNQLAITGKEYVILYGPRVLGALVLLVLAWIVAGWAGGATRRGLRRAKVDDTLARFFGNLAKWVVLLAGILSILGIFGVETASFAGILAGAAFAVGMAFAGTLGNFAAGVLLLTFRPFKVGDVISAAGVTGKVEEIGLFATVLDTPDNRRMIVGNQSIVGSNIENITFHETRRVQVDVGTDYGADLDETRKVLEQAISSVDGVLDDPAPQVYLDALGASSVDWKVRAWCPAEDFWGVREKLTYAVKVHLDRAGIGIPYPQMDVHVDQVQA